MGQNGSFHIEVNGLDLLSDHLDLLIVPSFAANWEPLLQLHELVVRHFFLKRAWHDIAVAANLCVAAQTVVPIDHLFCGNAFQTGHFLVHLPSRVTQIYLATQRGIVS